MKRWNYILLASLMVLGLTQCKKDLDLDQPTNAKTYQISLTVDNNSKVDVTPASDHATVEFEDGDFVYVGYNGKYVGTLAHDGSKFTGSITLTEAENPQPLYFYFIGNQTPLATLAAGTTTEFSFMISDQTKELPVVSMAPSTEGSSIKNFSPSTLSYSAALDNKCALVKFTTDKDIVAGTVTLWGMRNKCKVTFNNPGFSSWVDNYTTVEMKLHRTGNREFWAIVMPNSSSITDVSAKALGCLKTTGIQVPAINPSNCNYYNSGIEIKFEKAPEQAFSTSLNDTYIKFATGNLRCTKTGTTWDDGYTWSFMTNQYDIDHFNTCDVGVNYANKSVISHFGWGTSGYNGPDEYAPLNYKPNSTSKDTIDKTHVRNLFHYGPSWTADPILGNSTNTFGVDITGDYSNFDWGVYHSTGGASGGPGIMDGTAYSPYSWRLFTKAEIVYILGPNKASDAKPGTNCRYSSTIGNVENARFVKVRLSDASNGSGSGLNGLIIFPDVYEHPDPTLVHYPTHINDLECSFTVNSYTTTEWGLMEAKGAIFLPAAGCHDGNKIDGINMHCYYWTSTYNNYSNQDKQTGIYDNQAGFAKNLRVGDESMVTDSRTQRWRGNSVRLVRDVPTTTPTPTP